MCVGGVLAGETRYITGFGRQIEAADKALQSLLIYRLTAGQFL